MKRLQLAIFSITFSLAISAAFAATSASTHPIVDAQSGYLLGGSRNGKWVSDKETANALHKSNTQHYRFYKSSSEYRGGAGGSRPQSAGAPCDETFLIKLSSTLAGRTNKDISLPSNGVIAVGGDWNALLRKPRPQNLNQKLYRNVVAKILKAHKIKNPKVIITQLWRVDLDGDRTEEVLLSATNYAGEKAAPKNVSSSARAGEYSLVLLRKIVKGKVKTITLAQEIYAQNKEFSAPNIHSIAGVYDLNGDGKMEIVLYGRYYEGDWTSVIEVKNDVVKEVLSAGCGA